MHSGDTVGSPGQQLVKDYLHSLLDLARLLCEVSETSYIFIIGFRSCHHGPSTSVLGWTRNMIFSIINRSIDLDVKNAKLHSIIGRTPLIVISIRFLFGPAASFP